VSVRDDAVVTFVREFDAGTRRALALATADAVTTASPYSPVKRHDAIRQVLLTSPPHAVEGWEVRPGRQRRVVPDASAASGTASS
jgi:hypothetical protein